MSKTVIIPECMSPFEVFVNGKYYVYPAGTTQVVPDDVAVVIEHHEQMHKAQMTQPSDGLGDSATNEIKLESYVDSNNITLADQILGLFAEGGGMTTITGIDNLWADLKANKEIRVTMPYQRNEDHIYTVATDSITRLWWKDNCIQLSINMMFMLDDGKLYNIYAVIVFQPNGNHGLLVRAA